MKSSDTLRLTTYDENEIARCTNVENRYVCSICVEIFLTVEKLKIHYINVHGYRSAVYESSDSSQSEKETKRKEKEVVKTVVVKAPKICEICNQPFKTAKILSRHIKHVHNKIKNFHCSVCSKQFSRKAALQIHLRQHLADPESSKVLACGVGDCKFRSGDPSVLTKHRKIHQTGNEGKLKCPAENCDYHSIQSSSLIRHVISIHPAIYPTMKCSYKQCDFASVNPERLRKHLYNHDLGLFDKKIDDDSVDLDAKQTSVLNSSMEISSDCFIPVESTDSSVANHSLDTGGVTIIHEDTVF